MTPCLLISSYPTFLRNLLLWTRKMERKVLSSDTVSYSEIWICVLELCFSFDMGGQTFACCVWSILRTISKPTESRDSIQRLCMFFPLPFTLFVRSSSIYLLCGVSKSSFSRWTVRSHASALWGTDCLVPVALRFTHSPCVPLYRTKIHANVQQSSDCDRWTLWTDSRGRLPFYIRINIVDFHDD